MLAFSGGGGVLEVWVLVVRLYESTTYSCRRLKQMEEWLRFSFGFPIYPKSSYAFCENSETNGQLGTSIIGKQSPLLYCRTTLGKGDLVAKFKNLCILRS